MKVITFMDLHGNIEKLQTQRCLVNHACYSAMANHENDHVSLDSIEKAADRIQPCINKTPILTSSYLDKLTNRNLFFKCETFQKTGSFKFRGVSNSILRIKGERQDEDFVVVTHSSGNHAQAVALAASMHNVKSMIVVPSISPQVKKDAVRNYGGTLLECRPTPQARHTMAAAILEELGHQGEFIPSADHPFMFEGQGTIGLEMLHNVPELDAVVVCCGTGGLLSGVAVACKQLKPEIQVFAAEPTLADDTAQSFRKKRRIVLSEYPNTIADGLRMSIGVHTWPVIRDNITDVLTVTDDEIVQSMFLLWERMKLVVEPSGAVAFAAVLSEKFKCLPKDIQNVGIILSGGNIDLQMIPWMSYPERYDLSTVATTSMAK